MPIDKDELLEKMKQQLDDINQRWRIERDKFEAKAEQITAEVRKKIEPELEDLDRLRKQMKEKIIELEVAGENAWDEVKDSAEDAWDDLKEGTEDACKALSKAIKKAASHFK